MKTNRLLNLIAIAAIAFGLSACKQEHDHSHGDHDHSHDHGHDHAHGNHDHGDGDHEHEKKTAGPNGGRLLEAGPELVEFLVTEDRHVQLTFLAKDLKPHKPEGKTATLTGGERTAPVELTFSQEGHYLKSDKALPEGKSIPVILQINVGAESEPVIEKFHLDMSDCATCDFKEYACICDHAHPHE